MRNPLRADVHVTVETRENSSYYFDHEDFTRHVTMWIDDGLSCRDGVAQVTVTTEPPRVTLAEQLKGVLDRPTKGPGCRLCSSDRPEPPCKCGHDYHGHGALGLGPRQCLNCQCPQYQGAEDYPRCGAWGGCTWPLGHNKGHSDIPENHQTPEQRKATPEGCPECGDSGACNGGLCPLLEGQPSGVECAASTSGDCLAERHGGPACDTRANECVHGGQPAEELVELVEPDNPTAHALAMYIADHPVSTIQAAFRELGWRMSFKVIPEEDEPGPSCLENPDCDGNCCQHSTSPEVENEVARSICVACQGSIRWVDGPTGGWWTHQSRPKGGDHLTRPSPSGCPSGLLPAGIGPAVRCVVLGRHRIHRATSGAAWTGEEI